LVESRIQPRSGGISNAGVDRIRNVAAPRLEIGANDFPRLTPWAT
jgi:hypothetical protein